MSRHRSRSCASQPDDSIKAEEHQEVDECIAIMETTITDNTDRKSGHQSSKLAHLMSWPLRLFSAACCWLTLELGQVLEERGGGAGGPTDDPIKFLPSVASFVIGLVLVKNYGDTLDSAISTCLGSWGRAIRGLLGLLAGLSCDDLEGLVTVGVVVLFWIGAYRIVANVVGKLAEAPKICSCNPPG